MNYIYFHRNKPTFDFGKYSENVYFVLPSKNVM